MSILDEIVARKKEELKKKEPIDQAEIGASIRNFKDAISKKNQNGINLIAEIKMASPSKGVIREDINIEEIAGIYEKNADAISVLTDEKFFQGSLKDMSTAKKATTKPILRKDFIINEYQIYEARKYGADAVLLIASILKKEEIDRLIAVAKKLNMDCIVEVHTEEELHEVLETNAEIIGINNRNLETFKVDINTTLRLAEKIPKSKIIVSESGIETREDIEKLKGNVNAVLVGTALMKAEDIEKKIKELI